MTTNIDEFDFSGSEGAAVAKEANKGGDFAREIEFLNLKADEASIRQGKDKAIVRLVTEHERKPWMGTNTPWSLLWITVKQHYAPTKPKPPYSKDGQTWPTKMFAVCRKDKVFRVKYHDDCIICNGGNKPSDRTWALGIEREEVRDEQGRVIGMRDKTREVFDRDEKGDLIVLKQNGDDKEYKKKTVPAWVVLNFGWKNFFGNLNGQAGYFQTCLDRDFLIQRSGTGNNDTNYTFIALNPITITGEWANQLGVPEGTPYDMGHIVTEIDGRPIPLMEMLYPDMPDLRRIVAERTSEAYYGRWFIPGWLPEGFDPNAQQGQQGVQNGVQNGYQPPQGQQQAPPQQQAPTTPESASAASSAPSGSALDALRARVQGQQTGASQ